MPVLQTALWNCFCPAAEGLYRYRKFVCISLISYPRPLSNSHGLSHSPSSLVVGAKPNVCVDCYEGSLAGDFRRLIWVCLCSVPLQGDTLGDRNQELACRTCTSVIGECKCIAVYQSRDIRLFQRRAPQFPPESLRREQYQLGRWSYFASVPATFSTSSRVSLIVQSIYRKLHAVCFQGRSAQDQERPEDQEQGEIKCIATGVYVGYSITDYFLA
jgi:hypothetical protein